MIFVEILDRRGRVVRRERLDRFPATVGRAYTSDVILDDRFVGPEHLRILETENGLAVEDCGSVNGTYLYGAAEPFERIPLAPGTEVRAGHTRLRFRAPGEAVPPALRTARSGLAKVFDRPWKFLAGTAVAVGLLLVSDFVEIYRTYELSDAGSTLAAVVVYLLLWSGLWSIGNRIVSHTFRFPAHLLVGATGAAGLQGLTTFFEYVEFFFSRPLAVDVLEWTARGLFTVALVYAHLSIASTMIPRVRAAAAGVATAIFFGLLGLGAYARAGDFSWGPEYPTELKPVGAGWIRSRPADAFFASAASLEEELDKLAAEDEEARNSGSMP